MEYVIEALKTEKGIRYVSMTEEVAESFRRTLKFLAFLEFPEQVYY